jgi:hypothetical protein
MNLPTALLRVPCLTTRRIVLTAEALVDQLQDERDARRAAGDFLGEVDARLSDARTDYAGALLGASKIARDSGSHQAALALARLYAEQEHLALTLRGGA